MTSALGFVPTNVYVAATQRVPGMTACDLVAQGEDRARLHFRVEAHDGICVLTSRLDQDDATWPPLFHRLAQFGADGPKVALRLDAGQQRADVDTPSWSALEQVASEEERAAFEELLGQASLAVELTLGASDEGTSQVLLSSLQSRSVILTPSAMSPAQRDEVQERALTALRTSIAEYYTSSDWEHIRIQLDGSVVGDVPRESLMFKLYRTPASIGLEFRPDLETGVHPFQSFPGTLSDEFGQVYRFGVNSVSGELELPEAESITPADQTLLDTIVAALYPTMRNATLAVGHLDERTYAGWMASAAAFAAAYATARKLG